MAQSSWFQRFLLPGFAFKAVVIGCGYATGRKRGYRVLAVLILVTFVLPPEIA